MSEDSAQEKALEAEVDALRAELAEQKKKRSWTSVWRPVVSGLLLAVIVVLAPLCVVARWTHAEIADTNKYVDTVAPLSSNPDVQAAIAHRISTVIFQYVDVQGITEDAANALANSGLSNRAVDGLKALSGPLDSAVQNFVEERVLAVVQSDAFEQAWIAANRQAHSQMVAALTGETGGSVTVSEDKVTVNLAAFIDTVKQALVDQGFRLAERIPPVDASFVIFSSADLSKAQNGFHLLDLAATVLPILVLLLIAVAVLVARSRRSALIAAGLCVALGMILLGLLLTGARPFYLDALPSSVSQDAAAALYDTLIASMRRNLRIVLAIALLTSLVAWCMGPSRSARRLRSATKTGATRARSLVRDRAGHVDTGQFGHTLWDLRTPIRIGIVAVGALVVLAKNPVTAGLVTWTVVLMLVAWLALEVLASPSETDPDAPEDTTPDAAAVR